MATCGFCGSTVVIGGKRADDKVFCNNSCYEKATQLAMLAHIPDDLATRYAQQVHTGACPKCSGPGPNDVYTSHMIWSALILTRWGSKPVVCCRKCGIRQQIGYSLFSLVCGWWGFPWGIILTPIQIGRNIVGICRPPDPKSPSAQMEAVIRLDLAKRLAEEKKRHAASTTPS